MLKKAGMRLRYMRVSLMVVGLGLWVVGLGLRFCYLKFMKT
jgi:hypothetical protein